MPSDDDFGIILSYEWLRRSRQREPAGCGCLTLLIVALFIWWLVS